MLEKKVCVLTLNYNGKPLLKECIDSYLKNDYPNFEIVVIDNNSADGSQKFIKEEYPGITLIENQANLGYSKGFNVGLEYAFNNNAEYALITNNDVKADKNIIKELVAVAEKDNMIGFVTGKVYYYDNPSVLQSAGYYLSNEKYWLYSHRGGNEEDKGQYDKTEEVDYSDDIFILVSRNVYDTCGGYDPNFQFQAEQFDWQIRAREAGFKIWYAPKAKLYHKESMTLGKTSPFKTFYNTRNTYVLRLKHKDRKFNRQFSLWYFKSKFLTPLIKHLLKCNFNIAFAVIRGYFSAIKWGIRNKKIF